MAFAGFADAYTQNNIDTRVAQADRQSQFVDQRLKLLADAAEQADDALARYRAAHNLATTGGANGVTINDQQIAPLSEQLATAESDAAAARAKYQAAAGQASAGRAGSVPSVLSSALITELQAQRTQVLRNVAEVDARYGPLHPETTRVHRQLADVDRAITAESQRIIASLRTDSQAADARSSSLRARLGALRGEQAGDERASVEADALQRRADSARLIYTQFAQAAQQLGQERQSREPQARLFNRAQPAGAPSFPNRKLLVVLGLVVGLVAGLALIVLLDVLDGAVRTVDDVERGMGAPLAACLPRLRGGASSRRRAFDALGEGGDPQYAEAVRALRSSVVLAARGAPRDRADRGRVVAVTGAIAPAEAAAAAALARALAQTGRRVCYVDAQPDAGDRLGDGSAGAGPKAEAGASGERVVDAASGLAAFTLDRRHRDHLAGGPQASDMLEALRSRFDWVVVETAPVLGSADARTLCAEADLVVLMVQWGRTRLEAAQNALDRLDADGARVLGAALVEVNTSAPDALGRGAQGYIARPAAS